METMAWSQMHLQKFATLFMFEISSKNVSPMTQCHVSRERKLFIAQCTARLAPRLLDDCIAIPSSRAAVP